MTPTPDERPTVSFVHLTLLTLKDRTDADRVIEIVESYRGQLPQVRSLFIGPDVSGGGVADLLFVASFETQADFVAYGQDPAHLELASQVRPFLAASSSLDVETPAGADGVVTR